jgi:Transglycosylase SLT domain
MFSLRHVAYSTVFLLALVSPGSAKPEFNQTEIDVDWRLASLPLPARIEPIAASDILDVISPSGALRERSTYLSAIVQEAEANRVPPAVVDAVVRIESQYDPTAVGSVGEIGLMQVRPKTAALLGFQGETADLAEPQTNLRYGVSYLAKAWRLAGGDLCRALMKYRAGHGSERMSALSIEYCRRARVHLAAVGTGLPTLAKAPTRSLNHLRKNHIQLKRVATRAPTVSSRLRHVPVAYLNLSRPKPSFGVAKKTRIAAAQATMSAHRKIRSLGNFHQARGTIINRKLRAAKSRVAYRWRVSWLRSLGPTFEGGR